MTARPRERPCYPRAMGKALAAPLLCLACAACTHAAAPAGPDPQFIHMVEPWPYPFSSAVRTGDLLFVSGQIGTRLENGAPALVPGGIEPETRQTLDNIRAIVEKAGTSMDRVVKCMVMLADMQDWPAVNAIYATYFPGPKPARSAFGATGLALGARVEIECTAKLSPAR